MGKDLYAKITMGANDWELELASRDVIFDPTGNTNLMLHVSLRERERTGRYLITQCEGEKEADVFWGGSLFRYEGERPS
jgi:hypothetical protein